MSGAALALVLAAAVAHAWWNFAAKRVAGDQLVFVWLYVAASAVLWVPVAVVVGVVSGDRPTLTWLWAAAVSAVVHVVYNLVLQHGLAAGDLNLVYPLARGTGPLLTVLVATTLLGEDPGTTALLGVAAVLVGILVISVGSRASGPVRPGVVWGVVTGAAIASYTLWDHHAVSALDVPPLSYFALGLVLQAVPLSVSVRSRPERVRAVWTTYRREVLTVAVLSPLAYVLVLQALTIAPVSLVAPVRESSIVIGSLLGWLVLRERQPERRLAGAAVVLAGIALIATG